MLRNTRIKGHFMTNTMTGVIVDKRRGLGFYFPRPLFTFK
jgi:hypothetical protein